MHWTADQRWIFDEDGDAIGKAFRKAGEDGKDAPAEARALLIVRAVNAHAALVAACKRALHLVEENSEEIVQMVGAFGLWAFLKEAITLAEHNQNVSK